MAWDGRRRAREVVSDAASLQSTSGMLWGFFPSVPLYKRKKKILVLYDINLGFTARAERGHGGTSAHPKLGAGKALAQPLLLWGPSRPR